MLENIMLSLRLGRVFQVPLEQHLYDSYEPTSPDIREDDTQDNAKQPPVGVSLTGFQLFMISWIPGLLVPKALYFYREHSEMMQEMSWETILTILLTDPTQKTLDWVGIFILITIGLGWISDKHPESWPGFFKVDLAPCILKLLRRRDVLSCFSFALPLLLAVEGMPTMMLFLKDHIKPYIAEYYPAITSKAREAPAQFDWDGPTQFALGVFVVVFLFCIACAKVFWPKFFRGNGRHLSLIAAVMQIAHEIFLIVNLGRTNSDQVMVFKLMTLRLYRWLAPTLALSPSLPECEGFLSSRFRFLAQILRHFITYCIVISLVDVVIWEVTVMYEPKMPKVPALYSALFFCGVLIAVWRRLSAIIPSSWVAWFTSRVRPGGGS